MLGSLFFGVWARSIKEALLTDEKRDMTLQAPSLWAPFQVVYISLHPRQISISRIWFMLVQV